MSRTTQRAPVRYPFDPVLQANLYPMSCCICEDATRRCNEH
jgi:hypothetical protein